MMDERTCPDLVALCKWCDEAAAERKQALTDHVYSCSSCTDRVAVYVSNQPTLIADLVPALKGPGLVVGIVLMSAFGAGLLGLVAGTGGDGLVDSASAPTEDDEEEVEDEEVLPVPLWVDTHPSVWSTALRQEFLASGYGRNDGIMAFLYEQALEDANTDMVIRALCFLDSFPNSVQADGSPSVQTVAVIEYLNSFEFDLLQSVVEGGSESSDRLPPASETGQSKLDTGLEYLNSYLDSVRPE
ncbi:MAG: hypothetical protein V3W41_13360 [Planctomycetota bacterium]